MTTPPREMTPLMREITAYIAGALERPLPPEAAEKTRHCLLDTLACMISGLPLKPGRIAVEMVRAMGGSPEALVVGTDLLTNGLNAAFANGMTARADETDDVHARSRTHPGAGMIPSALAMAEREGRSGEALLRAIALGYDIGCRLTPALGLAQLEDRGFGPQPIGQQWGAAAAAGALAGLDQTQARYLLAYAAQQTSGLETWYGDLEHVEASFFMGGMSSRDGYAAAAMVAAGFTANPDVFAQKPRSFLDIFSSRPDPSELTRDLGRRFEIMDSNIKKWWVGSPIHAALESLLQLRREHGLAPAKVKRVRARLPARDAVIVDGRNSPNINLHHVLAIALIDGDVSFAAAHDFARMKDPAILAEKAKIELIRDDELQKLMPRRTATVEITTADGRELKHHTPAVLGTKDRPMSREQVAEKATALIAPAFGERRTRELVEAIWSIERIADVRELRPRLSAGG
ncbi:MAG: MmgE/PrpD family protein [Proteobacteria bacterium]|nr:MmgE/PrpD family protein [Pseudomonadota bacterium]